MCDGWVDMVMVLVRKGQLKIKFVASFPDWEYLSCKWNGHASIPVEKPSIRHKRAVETLLQGSLYPYSDQLTVFALRYHDAVLGKCKPGGK